MPAISKCLARLMSNDHTFVDTGGGVVAGKEECLAARRGFFESFPDYATSSRH
jgi:hypothetical protein